MLGCCSVGCYTVKVYLSNVSSSSGIVWWVNILFSKGKVW